MALSPEGLELDLSGFHLRIDGAVGAQAQLWVGDGADSTLADPYTNETVRILPAALGVGIERGPAWAGLRIEEGTVHAGGLEAGEARVGLAGGPFRAWIGRSDLPWSLDRDVEIEDQAPSLRPVLSRTVLPLHATGAGLELSPAFATVEAGASWTALSSDAPWLWARARLHPLPRAVIRPQLGGALLRSDSPSLGEQWAWAADLRVESDPAWVSGGYAWARTGSERAEAWVELGGQVPLGPVEPQLVLRGERATGLAEGEDLRWIGLGRVGLGLPAWRLSTYVELLHSVEEGTPAGVLSLDGGADRANDAVSLGLLLRL